MSYLCTTDAKEEPPLTLTYDKNLEEASDSDVTCYYDSVEKNLMETIDKKLKVKKIILNAYHAKHESKFTSLVLLALKSQVAELDVSYLFDYEPEEDFKIDLGHSFFINSHLTHLNLSCNFSHPPRVSLDQLKSLSLSNLYLTEDFFQKILSGCSLLETFKLDNCYGDVWELNITSTTVKHFEISGNKQFRHGNTCVRLKAPHVTSLTIKGSLVLDQIVLFDLHSLKKANIDYCEDDDGNLSPMDEEEVVYRHAGLIRGAGVKPILGTRCLEVESRFRAKGCCIEDYYKEDSYKWFR